MIGIKSHEAAGCRHEGTLLGSQQLRTAQSIIPRKRREFRSRYGDVGRFTFTERSPAEHKSGGTSGVHFCPDLVHLGTFGAFGISPQPIITQHYTVSLGVTAKPARNLHTVEVTGSSPVSPTTLPQRLTTILMSPKESIQYIYRRHMITIRFFNGLQKFNKMGPEIIQHFII